MDSKPGLLTFECDACGSSVVSHEANLGALTPVIDEESYVIQCGDHQPPLPMRRVD